MGDVEYTDRAPSAPEPSPSREASSPALRLTVLLVYAAIASASIATLAPGLSAAGRALVRPYAYEPRLASPWVWLTLAALLLALLWDVARRLLAGSRVRLGRYAVVLAAAALAVAWRRWDQPPTLAMTDEALRHGAARAVHALQAAYKRDGRYPDRAELLVLELPPVARFTGLWRRGLRAVETHVAYRDGATEPQLVDDGFGPGTVVVAVDASRQRFWVTAFGLSETGRVEPVPDGSGRVLTAAGAAGRPVSRGLEAFFEYPRKAALPDLASPP
jgi:hypothetical protein